ncbi:MAG TPA: hypothetical protein VGJ36_00215 [Gemmatimonadales bacterium]|jgi:hypothetical protein
MHIGASAALVSGSLLLAASLCPQQQAMAQAAQPTDARLIAVALGAAPARIAKSAAVIVPGEDGKMRELRAGTNGFTCVPDDPQTPGRDPMCLDANGMKWLEAYMAHTKPANTAPGIAYMLKGGSDISANDPYAKPGKSTRFVSSPPHYMILWPFDPETTGLPTTPKKTGSWIMWAGTPYAHLMVNQVP